MTQTDVIKIENLCKSFEKQVVLDHLDLTIKQGELFVLLGSSGAGKSVLLKHIMGLLSPDQGTISVLDHLVTSMNEKELLAFRHRIGMVFQNAALFDSYTVYENVAFPLRELEVCNSEEEIHETVDKNLKSLHIGQYSHKMPSELSGGMKKRVALARSLSLNSEIVLYDEPTAGLDPILAQQVDDIIDYVNKKLSKTTVVVTHDIDSAMHLADRIGVLKDGKLIFTGTPQELALSKIEFIKNFLKRYMMENHS